MTAGTTEIGESPPLEAVLSAVSDEHRRAVIRSLAHADGEGLSTRSLTDRVAERVRNGETPDGRHRRQVHTALHHVHLPKLEECGLIVRETDTGQVRSVANELSHELLTVAEPYEARV